MKKTLRPSGGHILDIDASEIADQFLSLAHNVHTRKGFPTRINGRRVAYSAAPANALHLLNLSLNTFNWWMVFGNDYIHAVEGSNDHDITFPGQLTVTDTSEWVSTLLNGIPVFTNGKDAPLFWTGDSSDNADVLPDWPAGTVCKAIVAFKFHLFALNIDGPSGTFENLILWSDAAEPGTLPASWTPGPANESGSASLSDTPGRCIIARPLGQQLMIYKPTANYAAEYVGQPDIYTVRPINRTLGVLGPHCVLEIDMRGPKHLIIGNDDIVLSDGVSVQSIADNRIKNFLATSIDETNAANSFIVRDLNKRETWVCVPEQGSQFATVAHVWDERRDTWVTRDLDNVRYGTTGYVTDTSPSNVWDSQSIVWDSAIQLWNASSDAAIPRVLTIEADDLILEDTGDATVITSRLVKQDMHFDEPDSHKLTQRVWIVCTGVPTGMQFRLGARNGLSDETPITWGVFINRSDNGVPYEVDGRYISIEIQNTSDRIWTIDRVIIEWVLNGAQ